MPASRRWIRLDVTWDASEWVAELSPLSQLAWVKLLCWAKVQGKGGRCKALTPKAAGKKWDVPAKAVADMLAAAPDDTMVTVDGDWVLLHWLAYQEPDTSAAERMQRMRAKRAPVTSDVTDVTRNTPVTRRVTLDHRQGEVPGSSPAVEITNLPDSSRSARSNGKAEKAAKRWRFCPKGFEPSAQHVELARSLGLNLEDQLASFRDHEFDKPKSDPSRTFSQWLRRAREFTPRAATGSGKTPDPWALTASDFPPEQP